MERGDELKGMAARSGARGRWGEWLRARGKGARERERERERTRWQDVVVTPARPLVRPAPRSAMFFPLVVLVAVLPGLYALNSWDLTPPGPWWGLRALAVLDGYGLDQVPASEAITPAVEAWVFRNIACQPPLYAWLAALGMALSPDRNPLASVLPSYVAGAVAVILVFFHGKLWRGPGTGLVAAILVGFNRDLLLQMQQGAPTTLALAGVLGALYGYARHSRAISVAGGGEFWDWENPLIWAAFGGLSLAISLLSIGLFGLWALVVVLVHQLHLFLKRGADAPADREHERELFRVPTRRWLSSLIDPQVHGGPLALTIAALIAAPWYLWVIRTYGSEALSALATPFDVVGRFDARPGLLSWTLALAPTTLPLGLYGAARAIRLAVIDEDDERSVVGGSFWVVWLAVAALAPAFWPRGPWHLFGLFLLVPLNLLAATTISDLATRKIPVRRLIWIAPATAATIAWWVSAELRNAVADLLDGRADSATALGVHLAVDLLIVALWLTRRIDRWARRRDDRQRRALAGFLIAVLAVTVAAGFSEIRFRNRETNMLLMLRTMILRRDRERPFTVVAVVGPESFRQTSGGPTPGGRLRFILRTALPHIPQRDLDTADELVNLPEGQRLVILAGSEQRLPSSTQARLKLEAIHPGQEGVLDAFATANPINGGTGRRP